MITRPWYALCPVHSRRLVSWSCSVDLSVFRSVANVRNNKCFVACLVCLINVYAIIVSASYVVYRRLRVRRTCIGDGGLLARYRLVVCPCLKDSSVFACARACVWCLTRQAMVCKPSSGDSCAAFRRVFWPRLCLRRQPQTSAGGGYRGYHGAAVSLRFYAAPVCLSASRPHRRTRRRTALVNDLLHTFDCRLLAHESETRV